MIARHFLLFVLMIVLADVYIDRRYLRHKAWWHRLLWWVPCLALLAYTVVLARERDFLPADLTVVNVYLFLLGFMVIPKLLFSLFAGVGRLWCRLFHRRHNYGVLLGLGAVLVTWYILIYGTFAGFHRLEVRHVELSFADLPSAFDGYRLVQFSDAHVGTLTGSRQKILTRALDSIKAQHPDMIVFTGDLQNTHPRDLYPQRDLLATLAAPDGVYSVLGNHDYAVYQYGDDVERTANCRETQSLERQMGWTLLMNEHRAIVRDGQRLIVAGMENWGRAQRMPREGDVGKTLRGVGEGDFIVMLQHDPTCWREKILPESHAQLTLSGHTHAMQFELFGWSPVAFSYHEYDGLYLEGARCLFVSKGLGGVIPFRFGATGEIVVITLRKS